MNTARKKTAAIVILATAAIVGVYWQLTPPRRNEPAYRGRTLTQWLIRLDDGQAFGISSRSLPHFTARQPEAAEAIRAMGTNALPFLIEDIHATPSENELRFRVQRGLNLALARFSGARVSFGEVTHKDRVRWRAAQGMAVLGPLAKPAIPQLKRLLLTNYFHSSIKEAAYVLAAVGPEGIEILTNAVARETEWSEMCAIWALGQHPAAGTNLIPFLMAATTSSSEGTTCGAIQVLGLFQSEPDRVIPVLTNALANRSSAVRNSAAWALGQFGPAAALAAPLLQLRTNDAATRRDALEALKRIQPGR